MADFDKKDGETTEEYAVRIHKEKIKEYEDSIWSDMPKRKSGQKIEDFSKELNEWKKKKENDLHELEVKKNRFSRLKRVMK